MKASSPLSSSLSSSIDHGTGTTTSTWRISKTKGIRNILRNSRSIITLRNNDHYEDTTPTATSSRTQLAPNAYPYPQSPGSSSRPESAEFSVPDTPRPETISKRLPSSILSPQDSLKFHWIRGELLGKGSFGKVYLALNATTGDIMAVKQVELPKTISAPNKHQQEMIDALKFESNTLKDLDHPHIVHYLGWEESPESLCIFMEYVSGGTIGSCLSSHGPFQDVITRSFTTQILGGIEYLHSRGIIHRDLKADNILVESDGTCKISDFGISKQAEDLGRAFTGMKGTVYWMAPEVVDTDKAKGYDAKIDIWSIGCVVLEMWSALRPWYGLELIPVMLKLAKEKSPPPIPKGVNVSDVGLDFRSKCFAREPQMRPSARELLRHPYLILPPKWCFEGFDADPSRHAHESEPTIRPVRTRRRQGSMKNAPPVPPIPPAPVIPPPTNHNQAVPTITQANYNAMKSSNAPFLPGPPVVYITPPSSPAVSNGNSPWSPEDTPSPSTSNSSARWSARRKKSFYVVNPDQEEERSSDRRFIYSPPPLPNIAGSSRLSVGMSPRRVTSSLTLNKQAMPRRAPSTPALRSSAYKMSDLSSPSTYVSSTHYSDSESDSDSGTALWKRPPAPTLTRDEPDDNMRKRASRISKVGTKRDSAWARPPAEEIYQNMDQCFPGHDIDKPILNQDAISSIQRKGGSIKRGKTLREMGQEQANDPARLNRRVTRLWGLQTEEVGT